LEEVGLSREGVRKVHEETGVPEADIYGAGRFYTLLTDPEAGIRVCQGLSCALKGSQELIEELRAQNKKVTPVSCLGQCDRAPVGIGEDLEVSHSGAERGAVLAADENLPINLGGEDVADYAALARVREKGADWFLAELKASGLQGRGGAGFPAHIKWNAVRQEEANPKYLVMNADEGEPGTFKDRECMLRRPHRVLEGLGIAATVSGARDIYIYVRGEFPMERVALEKALAESGDHLAELNFHFVAGHGAYICGEETALIESIEGKRGMPRLKPPFPTQVGLFGKPTLMNNVETLACVPAIALRGGQWFFNLGRGEAGTKLYCISGHVKKPGVYELPLGVALDELVEEAGGYDGAPRAFSPGGASSGFLPMSERNRPLAFKSLAEVGSMLGSAGVVVLNEEVDLAQAAHNQAIFFEDETCGQCAPCRIGTRMVRQALERYMMDRDVDALSHLEDVAWEMEEGSICGLGVAAPLPTTSAMKYFPEDFSAQAADGESQPEGGGE
jgi:NADH:ubiquinone oxidoreductase subunit F (NADH-binding)